MFLWTSVRTNEWHHFTTLYSGSSGNCALIRSEDKYLLVDMGKSCRTTLTALKSLGLAGQRLRRHPRHARALRPRHRDWIPF